VSRSLEAMAARIALSAASLAASELVQVPGGHVVDRSCILEVSNGKHVDLSQTASVCEGSTLSSPRVQIYASDVHLKSEQPLTSFTADWVVPPLPRSNDGQVVYFWPGFKSNQPEMGLPVLQPVLQFGEYGESWQLQSWFVDAYDPKYPVVTAPAIPVKPGDKLTSFMRLSEDRQTWTVSVTNLNSGEESTLHIKYAKAGNTDYDYAMLVNENINVNSQCSRMPDDSVQPGAVVFTNVTVNGAKPTWTTRANCAGNPQCDCHNAAEVAQNGDVSLKWNTASTVEV